jgi:dipeptidyl aminopeptidase/acylaminoacyl peptidase
MNHLTVGETSVKYALLLTLFAAWILTSCSPPPVSPQATARPSPSTTIEPEAARWAGKRIPTGCRFSSISPNFDWIIYSCKDKLWLARVADPANATLVIQDDNLIGTSWSPDGAEFAVGIYHPNQEKKYIASLWVFKRDVPSERRLLHQGEFFCDRQLWSPSGKWILTAGGGGKSGNAILVRTDGTGQTLFAPIGIMEWWHGASWSPDSAQLAYASSDEPFPDPAELRVLDVNLGTITTIYTQTLPAWSPVPAWSPDGKMIAVLAQSYPGKLVVVDSASKRVLNDLTLPTSWKQSTDLFWSPDSKRIVIPFFRDGHQIGIISLPSGEMSEVSGEELWPIFGWSKDGKSLFGLGEEGGQEAIQAVPVK